MPTCTRQGKAFSLREPTTSTEPLLCATLGANHYKISKHNVPQGGSYYYPHFTGVEAQAQRSDRALLNLIATQVVSLEFSTQEVWLQTSCAHKVMRGQLGAFEKIPEMQSPTQKAQERQGGEEAGRPKGQDGP